jgi:hypothetical protein
MVYRILFFDGERQISAFEWTLGVEAAIGAVPDFMAICGATLGCIRNELDEDVWSHPRP